MPRRRIVRLCMTIGLLVALAALPAVTGPAAGYPTKPVTLIIPFKAGSAPDTTFRFLAEFVEKDLGQKLVVVNRPDPGGTIGVSEVLQAPPAGQATRFLAERFGAPIAFVNTRFRLSHDRSLLRGYHRALRALGERERVLLVRAEEDRGREAVRALLAEAEPPRALFLASSLVVFDDLAALAEHGRKLGEDTGVVAVASEERPWTALLPAPLPLLAIPAREIGRRAAALTVPVKFLPGDLPR